MPLFGRALSCRLRRAIPLNSAACSTTQLPGRLSPHLNLPERDAATCDERPTSDVAHRLHETQPYSSLPFNRGTSGFDSTLINGRATTERPASPAAHSMKQAFKMTDESRALRGRVHAVVML
jgi:hypothetical protein